MGKGLSTIAKAYGNGNPFMKFLAVAVLYSAALTISSDIGNIVSTLTTEPDPIYEQPEPHYQIMLVPNTYQKTL